MEYSESWEQIKKIFQRKINNPVVALGKFRHLLRRWREAGLEGVDPLSVDWEGEIDWQNINSSIEKIIKKLSSQLEASPWWEAEMLARQQYIGWLLDRVNQLDYPKKKIRALRYTKLTLQRLLDQNMYYAGYRSSP